MSSYRVLHVGEKFFPQRKGWLLWHYFAYTDVEYYQAVAFATLAQAVEFCQTQPTSRVVWSN